MRWWVAQKEKSRGSHQHRGVEDCGRRLVSFVLRAAHFASLLTFLFNICATRAFLTRKELYWAVSPYLSIEMILLHACVGVFGCMLGTWMFYSRMLREAMEPVSRQNTIISQTRPEGNFTLMLELAHELPDVEDMSDFDVHIWGDKVNERSIVKQIGSDMIFVRDQDGKSGIYANREITQDKSLRQLVKSNGPNKIVVDTLQFRLWIETMLRTTEPSRSLSGKFHYSFRDYWNFEESWTLEVTRGSIRMLALRNRRAGELVIREDGTCILNEFHWMYGIVPLRLQWDGHMNGNVITWDKTLFHKGWSFLGRTIDRPPLAEKFRQEPWIILVPLDEDDSDDLIVIERQGLGRHVWAKESVFDNA